MKNYIQLLYKISDIIGVSDVQKNTLLNDFYYLIYQAFIDQFLDQKDTISDNELLTIKDLFDSKGDFQSTKITEFITVSKNFLPQDVLYTIYIKSQYIAFSQLLALIMKNALPVQNDQIEKLIKTQPELKELFK